MEMEFRIVQVVGRFPVVKDILSGPVVLLMVQAWSWRHYSE